MFGSPGIVRGTARNFRGYLIEAFDQCDRMEGLGTIMRQIPGTSQGVCKSLCMHWVAHHANDVPKSFAEVARSMGSGMQRSGGHFTGVAIALNQLKYSDALRVCTNPTDYNRTKDQFTDDFLRRHGILRQMKISNPALNLSPAASKAPPGLGPRPGLRDPAKSPTVQIAFGRRVAESIVGNHSGRYWSYKIISIHGSVGGHALAAFVGDDAMFFDPNYGVFYFENADDFRRWFGEPGGFYWTSGYVRHLGDDFVIKSYAKGI